MSETCVNLCNFLNECNVSGYDWYDMNTQEGFFIFD